MCHFLIIQTLHQNTKLSYCSLYCIHRTAKAIICHFIWNRIMGLSPNISFLGVIVTQSIINWYFQGMYHIAPENNTTTKYKIIWLSLDLNPRNCKRNHILSYTNMDDGIIFQYSNQRCIGNTIYSLVTFSRVIPLCDKLTLHPCTKLFDVPWNCIQKRQRQSYVFVNWYWRWDYLPIFFSEVKWQHNP